MSFLFEPVSAAIDTLKYIKSASKKGPDPNRFVTRVPINPGKWALATAFKRKHNLWKWTHHLPNRLSRKYKNKKKPATLNLKIAKPVGTDDDLEDETEDTGESSSKQTSFPPISSDQQGGVKIEMSPSQVKDGPKTDGDSEGTRRSSAAMESIEPVLDEDGLPFFPMPDDDEADQEVKRLSEMSPEQKVYYRSCEHFKVRPSKQVMKQVDTVELVLAHNKLRDIEFKAITTGLVMNFGLKKLDITDICPSERQMTYLNDFLEDDNGITDLILKDNRLEGRSFTRMFESMKHRDVMIYLDISGNNLRDKDLPMLAAYFESSSQLNYLYMGRNKFTPRAGEHLGKMMANAALLELSVCGNQLRGDGMNAFLQGVTRNSTLERLDISWNGVGPESIRALVTLIRTSSNLISLDLAGTRINGECLDLITTQGLNKNTVLQRLGLKSNPLLTNDITTFLNKVYNNQASALKRIDFGDYQALDSSLAPLLSQMFWERSIDVRFGQIFSYSQHTEAVAHVIQRFRQDALSLVTKMTRAERSALVKILGKIDMEEAMETGEDIPTTSFLGRLNEAKVTYKDLARRLAKEGGDPRDVVKSLLGKAELEESSKKMVSRFTIGPQDARRMQMLARST